MILFPMLSYGATSYTDPNCNNQCKDAKCVLSTQDGKYYCVSAKPGPDPSFGYKNKDCDNKCTKDQACYLDSETGRYSCGTAPKCVPSCNKNENCLMQDGSWRCVPNTQSRKKLPESGPAGIGISLTCEQIGGISKNKCSSKDVIVEKLSGSMDVSIANTKEQCCIPKTRLRVR